MKSQNSPNPSTDALVRAKALCAAGRLAWMQVDLETARDHLESGLALYRTGSDLKGELEALSSLMLVLSWRGDTGRAMTLLREGLEVANSSLESRRLATRASHAGLGDELDRVYGILEPAWAINSEVENLARKAGDGRALAWALDGLGQCCYFRGDYEGARPYLEEAQRLFKELGDWLGHGHVLWIRGGVARAQGRLDEAHELYAQVIAGPGAQNTPQGVPFGFEGLAYLAIAERQLERAAQLLAAAQRLRDQTRSVPQPIVREEYERQLAQLQGLMEPRALQLAWEQGREMDRDQLIRLATARPTATYQGVSTR